jgi:hypothetical protein
VSGNKQSGNVLFISGQCLYCAKFLPAWLKSGSTSAFFTARLEETGNTFTDFDWSNREKYPDIVDCDKTKPYTTGLMAVTTATGTVVSPDNPALVIAGYTIIKQTDENYSDRYIGFYNKNNSSEPQRYAPFVGIAVLTCNFNNKAYKFRDKDGYNTDDFVYRITEGTVNSPFRSYNIPAPVVMTTAKLTGAENRAYVVIDSTVYLLKDREFVIKTNFVYDIMDMAHLSSVINNAYNSVLYNTICCSRGWWAFRYSIHEYSNR